MKDVIITITATQATQDESDMDTLAEFSTVGAYSHADGCGTISYEDESMNFYKGDCIFVPADTVELNLHGQAQFLDVHG
jgi:mannose-6-phosphate isomerase class I